GYQAALKMVYEALERRATDIHLEPTKEDMTVRFRVDGILHADEPFSRQTGESVVNIFKVLADLAITEKRKPQDGSLSPEVRETIHQLAVQPHGLLIVCGPTGAGKSTTLYACLQEIDRYQKNVITVENPVEYNIPNVTQIEVNPKAGKTFASELRSILRQDPDVIYIGEIRDEETAEIGCQAAQTGHMVFTTVHANDTVTAIGRLIDLGVQPFLISSALSAVLGQRLVRLLCPKCKVRYKPNPDLLKKANLPADKIKYFYRPPEPPSDGEEYEPCPVCRGTGYHK